MILAIIGSRTLNIKNLENYLPPDVTEIVSGGAKGIDSDAAAYAREHGIKLTEFLPDYRQYRRGAPLRRNMDMADYADAALAFWDGQSRGTVYTVKHFRERGKPVILYRTTEPLPVAPGTTPAMVRVETEHMWSAGRQA